MYLDRIAELTTYARISWAAAGVSLALLALFAVRLGTRKAARQRSAKTGAQENVGLHKDDSAAASIEYLLVLFPFLIIVMTVWQFAFMINAKLHVGYATYAAARSAAVLIPMEMDDEDPGQLNALSSSKESKWTRIQRAARPGTIAISPGHARDAGGVWGAANFIEVAKGGNFNAPETPDALGTAARITLMSMHMCDVPIFCSPQALTGTRPLRAAIKDYYAQNMTAIRIQNVDHTEAQDLSSHDVITVRVDYVFWLQVPWVGRMLEAMFKGIRNPVTGEFEGLNPFPSMLLSEQTTINTWHKKRATEPCT